MNIHRIIEEAFDSQGNIVDAGISSAFGKGKELKPLVASIPNSNHKCYAVYGGKSADGTKDKIAMLRNIKAMEHPDNFTTRAAIYAASKIARPFKPDLLCITQSSSVLASYFAKAIAGRLSGVRIITATKNAASAVRYEPPEHLKDTKIVRNGYKALMDAGDGNLSMKRIHNSVRAFFHGLYSIDADARDIAGKRILIVDDLYTSGSTISSIASELDRLGAADVAAVVLFKAQ